MANILKLISARIASNKLIICLIFALFLSLVSYKSGFRIQNYIGSFPGVAFAQDDECWERKDNECHEDSGEEVEVWYNNCDGEWWTDVVGSCGNNGGDGDNGDDGGGDKNEGPSCGYDQYSEEYPNGEGCQNGYRCWNDYYLDEGTSCEWQPKDPHYHCDRDASCGETPEEREDREAREACTDWSYSHQDCKEESQEYIDWYNRTCNGETQWQDRATGQSCAKPVDPEPTCTEENTFRCTDDHQTCPVKRFSGSESCALDLDSGPCEFKEGSCGYQLAPSCEIREVDGACEKDLTGNGESTRYCSRVNQEFCGDNPNGGAWADSNFCFDSAQCGYQPAEACENVQTLVADPRGTGMTCNAKVDCNNNLVNGEDSIDIDSCIMNKEFFKGVGQNECQFSGVIRDVISGELNELICRANVDTCGNETIIADSCKVINTEPTCEGFSCGEGEQCQISESNIPVCIPASTTSALSDAVCKEQNPATYYCDSGKCIEKSSSFDGTSCFDVFDTASGDKLKSCPAECGVPVAATEPTCEGFSCGEGQHCQISDSKLPVCISDAGEVVKSSAVCKEQNPTSYYCDGGKCIEKSSNFNGTNCFDVFTNAANDKLEQCPAECNTASEEPEPVVADPKASFEVGTKCSFTEVGNCENGQIKACEGETDSEGKCAYTNGSCTACGAPESIDINNDKAVCEAGKCVNGPGKACLTDESCPQPNASCNFPQACDVNGAEGVQFCKGVYDEAGKACSYAGGSCTPCSTEPQQNPSKNTVAFCSQGVCLGGPGGACFDNNDCPQPYVAPVYTARLAALSQGQTEINGTLYEYVQRCQTKLKPVQTYRQYQDDAAAADDEAFALQQSQNVSTKYFEYQDCVLDQVPVGQRGKVLELANQADITSYTAQKNFNIGLQNAINVGINANLAGGDPAKLEEVKAQLQEKINGLADGWEKEQFQRLLDSIDQKIQTQTNITKNNYEIPATTRRNLFIDRYNQAVGLLGSVSSEDSAIADKLIAELQALANEEKGQAQKDLYLSQIGNIKNDAARQYEANQARVRAADFDSRFARLQELAKAGIKDAETDALEIELGSMCGTEKVAEMRDGMCKAIGSYISVTGCAGVVSYSADGKKKITYSPCSETYSEEDLETPVAPAVPGEGSLYGPADPNAPRAGCDPGGKAISYSFNAQTGKHDAAVDLTCVPFIADPNDGAQREPTVDERSRLYDEAIAEMRQQDANESQEGKEDAVKAAGEYGQCVSSWTYRILNSTRCADLDQKALTVGKGIVASATSSNRFLTNENHCRLVEDSMSYGSGVTLESEGCIYDRRTPEEKAASLRVSVIESGEMDAALAGVGLTNTGLRSDKIKSIADGVQGFNIKNPNADISARDQFIEEIVRSDPTAAKVILETIGIPVTAIEKEKIARSICYRDIGPAICDLGVYGAFRRDELDTRRPSDYYGLKPEEIDRINADAKRIFGEDFQPADPNKVKEYAAARAEVYSGFNDPLFANDRRKKVAEKLGISMDELAQLEQTYDVWNKTADQILNTSSAGKNLGAASRDVEVQVTIGVVGIGFDTVDYLDVGKLAIRGLAGVLTKKGLNKLTKAGGFESEEAARAFARINGWGLEDDAEVIARIEQSRAPIVPVNAAPNPVRANVPPAAGRAGADAAGDVPVVAQPIINQVADIGARIADAERVAAEARRVAAEAGARYDAATILQRANLEAEVLAAQAREEAARAELSRLRAEAAAGPSVNPDPPVIPRDDNVPPVDPASPPARDVNGQPDPVAPKRADPNPPAEDPDVIAARQLVEEQEAELRAAEALKKEADASRDAEAIRIAEDQRRAAEADLAEARRQLDEENARVAAQPSAADNAEPAGTRGDPVTPPEDNAGRRVAESADEGVDEAREPVRVVDEAPAAGTNTPPGAAPEPQAPARSEPQTPPATARPEPQTPPGRPDPETPARPAEEAAPRSEPEAPGTVTPQSAEIERKVREDLTSGKTMVVIEGKIGLKNPAPDDVIRQALIKAGYPEGDDLEAAVRRISDEINPQRPAEPRPRASVAAPVTPPPPPPPAPKPVMTQVQAEDDALSEIGSYVKLGGDFDIVPDSRIRSVLIEKGFQGTDEELDAAVRRIAEQVNRPVDSDVVDAVRRGEVPGAARGDPDARVPDPVAGETPEPVTPTPTKREAKKEAEAGVVEARAELDVAKAEEARLKAEADARRVEANTLGFNDRDKQREVQRLEEEAKRLQNEAAKARTEAASRGGGATTPSELPRFNEAELGDSSKWKHLGGGVQSEVWISADGSKVYKQANPGQNLRDQVQYALDAQLPGGARSPIPTVSEVTIGADGRVKGFVQDYAGVSISDFTRQKDALALELRGLKNPATEKAVQALGTLSASQRADFLRDLLIAQSRTGIVHGDLGFSMLNNVTVVRNASGEPIGLRLIDYGLDPNRLTRGDNFIFSKTELEGVIDYLFVNGDKGIDRGLPTSATMQKYGRQLKEAIAGMQNFDEAIEKLPGVMRQASNGQVAIADIPANIRIAPRLVEGNPAQRAADLEAQAARANSDLLRQRNELAALQDARNRAEVTANASAEAARVAEARVQTAATAIAQAETNLAQARAAENVFQRVLARAEELPVIGRPLGNIADWADQRLAQRGRVVPVPETPSVASVAEGVSSGARQVADEVVGKADPPANSIFSGKTKQQLKEEAVTARTEADKLAKEADEARAAATQAKTDKDLADQDLAQTRRAVADREAEAQRLEGEAQTLRGQAEAKRIEAEKAKADSTGAVDSLRAQYFADGINNPQVGELEKARARLAPQIKDKVNEFWDEFLSAISATGKRGSDWEGTSAEAARLKAKRDALATELTRVSGRKGQRNGQLLPGINPADYTKEPYRTVLANDSVLKQIDADMAKIQGLLSEANNELQILDRAKSIALNIFQNRLGPKYGIDFSGVNTEPQFEFLKFVRRTRAQAEERAVRDAGSLGAIRAAEAANLERLATRTENTAKTARSEANALKVRADGLTARADAARAGFEAAQRQADSLEGAAVGARSYSDAILTEVLARRNAGERLADGIRAGFNPVAAGADPVAPASRVESLGVGVGNAARRVTDFTNDTVDYLAGVGESIGNRLRPPSPFSRTAFNDAVARNTDTLLRNTPPFDNFIPRKSGIFGREELKADAVLFLGEDGNFYARGSRIPRQQGDWVNVSYRYDPVANRVVLDQIVLPKGLSKPLADIVQASANTINPSKLTDPRVIRVSAKQANDRYGAAIDRINQASNPIFIRNRQVLKSSVPQGFRVEKPFLGKPYATGDVVMVGSPYGGGIRPVTEPGPNGFRFVVSYNPDGSLRQVTIPDALNEQGIRHTLGLGDKTPVKVLPYNKFEPVLLTALEDEVLRIVRKTPAGRVTPDGMIQIINGLKLPPTQAQALADKLVKYTPSTVAPAPARGPAAGGPKVGTSNPSTPRTPPRPVQETNYRYANYATPQQDRAVVVEANGEGLYIVADGHGLAKTQRSDVASEIASEVISRNFNAYRARPGVTVEQAYRSAFRDAHQEILRRGKSDGTTLASAFIGSDNKVHVAILGDSEVLIGQSVGGNRLRADILVPPHDLTPAEIAAIRARGGIVRPDPRDPSHLRVYNSDGTGGINITRSLGDKDIPVLGRDLDYRSRQLTDNDQFLIIKSDGLNFISNDEAVHIAGDILARGGTPEQASQALIQAALRNGSDDNITVVVVPLNKPKKPVFGFGGPCGSRIASINNPVYLAQANNSNVLGVSMGPQVLQASIGPDDLIPGTCPLGLLAQGTPVEGVARTMDDAVNTVKNVVRSAPEELEGSLQAAPIVIKRKLVTDGLSEPQLADLVNGTQQQLLEQSRTQGSPVSKVVLLSDDQFNELLPGDPSHSLLGEKLDQGWFGKVFKTERSVIVRDPTTGVSSLQKETVATKIFLRNDPIIRALNLNEIQRLIEADGAGGLPRVKGLVTWKDQIVGYQMEYLPEIQTLIAYFFNGNKLTLADVGKILDRVDEIHTAIGPHQDLNLTNIVMPANHVPGSGTIDGVKILDCGLCLGRRDLEQEQIDIQNLVQTLKETKVVEATDDELAEFVKSRYLGTDREKVVDEIFSIQSVDCLSPVNPNVLGVSKGEVLAASTSKACPIRGFVDGAFDNSLGRGLSFLKGPFESAADMLDGLFYRNSTTTNFVDVPRPWLPKYDNFDLKGLPKGELAQAFVPRTHRLPGDPNEIVRVAHIPGSEAERQSILENGLWNVKGRDTLLLYGSSEYDDYLTLTRLDGNSTPVIVFDVPRGYVGYADEAAGGTVQGRRGLAIYYPAEEAQNPELYQNTLDIPLTFSAGDATLRFAPQKALDMGLEPAYLPTEFVVDPRVKRSDISVDAQDKIVAVFSDESVYSAGPVTEAAEGNPLRVRLVNLDGGLRHRIIALGLEVRMRNPEMSNNLPVSFV